ncbi:response regulator [Caenispirillum bisanense]|uniref:response regulator n=1 Tax=Caenispirillum bisanense TaxID=414052 RepID=UPI0011439E02|nr:response regulator [Caenispirillum bisanense]
MDLDAQPVSGGFSDSITDESADKLASEEGCEWKISFLWMCENDIIIMKLQKDDILEFIYREIEAHPLMFEASFSFLPLNYDDLIVMLSFDGARHLKVERVLPPELAFPQNEPWAIAVAAYRKTADLPYRSESRWLLRRQNRRATLKKFAELLRRVGEVPVMAGCEHLTGLVNEAEDRLLQGDYSGAVARLEAALSSVHKLLLRYTPGQCVGGRENSFKNADNPIGKVLIVDDHPLVGKALAKIITDRYPVEVVHYDRGKGALVSAVGTEYLAVILDMRMPDMDGIVMMKTMKMTGMRSKFIIFSAHGPESDGRTGYDAWIEKSFGDARIYEVLDTILVPQESQPCAAPH